MHVALQTIAVKRLGEVKVSTWLYHKEQPWQNSSFDKETYGDAYLDEYEVDIRQKLRAEQDARACWEPKLD